MCGLQSSGLQSSQNQPYQNQPKFTNRTKYAPRDKTGHKMTYANKSDVVDVSTQNGHNDTKQTPLDKTDISTQTRQNGHFGKSRGLGKVKDFLDFFEADFLRPIMPCAFCISAVRLMHKGNARAHN